MKAEEMKNKVENLVEGLKKEFAELSKFIYDNPELGYEEFKSSKAHVDLLRKHGFRVEEGYLGINTAFRAEYDSKKEGPAIAYLAEYDALPVIGHGCGHNILGTTSTGAGIVLSKLIDDIGGKVVVFGTPAEETSGAKVEMANRGAFSDIDTALIVHPAAKFEKSSSSLAMEAIQFTFKGKTAHAAAAPEKGINALDACIAAFNSINALRQHMLPSARVHGVIKEGGRAANIVPDLAVAQFYVRTLAKDYLKELSEKVKNCARAGALSAGAELEITNFEASFDNLVTNNNLHDSFLKNLGSVGINSIEDTELMLGSTDVGNVSQVCPTIHPSFGIAEDGVDITPHTVEFARATLTKTAHQNMLKTISALVLTGADVITDKELLRKIKEEFEAGIK